LPAGDRIHALVIGYPQEVGDRTAIIGRIRRATFSQTKREAKDWLKLEVVPSLGPKVIGSAFPWRPPPGHPPVLVEDSTELASDEWHVVKHRALGHLAADTVLDEYYDDIRTVLNSSTSVPRVLVGKDSKANADRAAVLIRLGNNGAPCRKVICGLGWYMFVVYDPGANRIVTAFPVPDFRVQGGYPYWDPKVEVMS
jgi:hypothetical protein